MKTRKLLLPGALSLMLMLGGLYGCNENPAEKKETTVSSATPNYPYTIEHPDNWETGNAANSLIALKCLKAWEDGNLEEAMKYFGDSVRLQFDGFDRKLSNDSVKSFFSVGRTSLKTIQIKMSDWESVVSKDKSEEWVTLWYKQFWETQQGVKDSVSMINDLQLKDGKIIWLAEHSRKLH